MKAKKIIVLLVQVILLVASALLADAATKTITERAKITPAEGGIRFGRSVALSGDRALVGDCFYSVGGLYSGAAYIFVYDGTNWTEQAQLRPLDSAEGDEFGNAVAIEGDRAVVGAFHKGEQFRPMGAVYIFEFHGISWNQTAKLVASDGKSNDGFGTSVSVSGDRVVIGTPGRNRENGVAYIFSFDGTTWNSEAKLALADVTSGDDFGSAVSISGTRALIGARGRDDIGTNNGAAYIFTFDGTVWTQEAQLLASDNASGDEFGFAVSLNGSRALIGAHYALLGQGAAYVFTANGTTWTQETKLTASDGEPNDNFGASVSLSGKRALVGAIETGNYPQSGTAYLYQRTSTSWSEHFKLIASDGMAQDSFGVSLSLSGNRLLVGAQNDVADDAAAYFFGALNGD
jgi:FG-GAP repeat